VVVSGIETVFCYPVNQPSRRQNVADRNVRLWLKADLQSPEIDFRYAPNIGHSQRNLYGISAQPRTLLGQLLALITRPDMAIVLLDHPD
jgi:hypothetical protein